MVLGPASAGGVCGAQSQIGVKLGAHTKSLGSSVSELTVLIYFNF